jgi:L-alanine-DL-glutamate epimerase-like enolase superfamily enzyme
MKITAIETTVLRLPEVKPIGDGCQSILLIRIRTDEGITGIGEVHTNPTVTKAIIDAPRCAIASRGLREILIGENPLEIGRLWDKMYQATAIYGRRGAVMHAISGIDIALWDILGKATGQPIHRLWGRAGRALPIYASD